IARLKNRSTIYAEINSHLHNQHVPYLLFEHDLENDQTNFSDPIHLTEVGRVRFTKLFASTYQQ
ncbi:MAG: hypothetical protein ABIS36_20735, partial [Chryseolinea sp.]